MWNNVKKLALISRPISWLNTAYPFGTALLVSGGTFSPVFWIGVVYFLIPYNLLMYGINDVFDYESDMRNPRKGGLEGAKEQKSFHPVIIISAILLNIPFLLYLFTQGSLLSALTLLAVVFFVVAYSVAGLRFKEIPLLDSTTSSIHFVGPMVYALTLTGLSLEYVPFILAFFLWGLASHAFGAVQDIVPDREGNLASIATVFGARSTTWLVFLLYLGASILLAAQGGLAILVAAAGLLYAANVAPYLRVTDATSGSTNKGWRRFIWLNLFTGFIVTMVLLVPAVL